jgi:hypothetical protein
MGGRKDEVRVYRVELKVSVPHTLVDMVMYFIQKHLLGCYGCVCHIKGGSHEANRRITIKALGSKNSSNGPQTRVPNSNKYFQQKLGPQFFVVGRCLPQLCLVYCCVSHINCISFFILSCVA